MEIRSLQDRNGKVWVIPPCLVFSCDPYKVFECWPKIPDPVKAAVVSLVEFLKDIRETGTILSVTESCIEIAWPPTERQKFRWITKLSKIPGIKVDPIKLESILICSAPP